MGEKRFVCVYVSCSRKVNEPNLEKMPENVRWDACHKRVKAGLLRQVGHIVKNPAAAVRERYPTVTAKSKLCELQRLRATTNK